MRWFGVSVLVFVFGCAARAPVAPVAAAAPATGVPRHRYLPEGYQGELFVDWAALRDLEVLDRLLRLPTAEEMLGMIAMQRGCRPDDLARERTAFLTTKDRDAYVCVLEMVDGAERPELPADWPAVDIGGLAGFRQGKSMRAHSVCWPAPGIALSGPAELLATQVAAEASGGPHPDLADVLAGDRVLAQIAYGRFGQGTDDVLRSFAGWFGDADDPVDFVRLRLSVAADDNLVFSITFRYQHGTSGLRATEAMVRGRIDEFLAEPRLAPFKQLFGAVVVAHRERDLTASLVLGEPKAAVAMLERTAIALMAKMSQDQAGGR